MKRVQVNKQRRTEAFTVPAPVGGLNDRDSISNMPANDALVLDNWFPSTRSVELRGGALEWATGLPATGETLMTYNGISSSKLFVVSNGGIYDVTSVGSVGSAAVSGLTNSRLDFVNFGGASGNFLVTCNSADLPEFYNGSSWTASGTGYATAITGIDAKLFSQVNVWKNRLFFVEENSLSCWFLGTQAIGGAATELDFAGIAKLGGKLVATATVSSSAGLTIDDYFVAITSEGECIVYQGTDPTNASTFAIVGNYKIGSPVANGSSMDGGRFICRLGDDTLVLTVNGIVSLQAALQNDVVAENRTITDKIINSIINNTTLYHDNFGWQLVLFPDNHKLIVNVPQSSLTDSVQYVMNTITGAWCRFTGWATTAFAYFNNELYGIIGKRVYKLDVPLQNDPATSDSIVTGYSILLHCDAISGTTTIDDSGKGNIATLDNGATIYATDKVFGYASMDLGTGSANDKRVEWSETANFNFGTADWAIAFRVKVTNFVAGKTHTIFTNGYGITINWIADTQLFNILISYNGATNAINVTSSTAAPYQNWYAILLECYSGNLYFYVDGVLDITATALTSAVYYDSTRTMYLGGASTDSLWGLVDEFAIIKGAAIANGAASYTVETVPFTSTDTHGTGSGGSSTGGIANVTADVKTSFQFYGGNQQQKAYKMVKPLIYCVGTISPAINIDVDFGDVALVGTANLSGTNGAQWDVALWDVALWATESALFNQWISVNGIGYCAALKMSVQANEQTMEWHNWTITYEMGGLI